MITVLRLSISWTPKGISFPSASLPALEEGAVQCWAQHPTWRLSWGAAALCLTGFGHDLGAPAATREAL